PFELMDFKEIYDQHWDKIYRLCMGYINDSAKAKDLAQETFIKVWKNLKQFKGDSKISTWIYRIAVNTCLRQIENDHKLIKTTLPDPIEGKNEPSPEPDIQLLHRFISELKEVDRIIISLELEGMKQAEIAKVIGISPVNVRVKIHRI